MTLRPFLAAALTTVSLFGQSPTQPVGLQPGEQYRILFVTDSSRDATSSDIADYDSLVTADADAAPELTTLNTSWRAVASTPSVDAIVHTGMDTGSGVPIYRPDGIRIADDYGHLFAGAGSQRYAPPSITASGATTASRTWTGSHAYGHADQPLGDASGISRNGAPAETTYYWIYANAQSQTNSRPLYAMSAVISVPFPAEIGTSCGSATLTRDTLPVLGTSFDFTLSGVPATGIGAVQVDIGVPGPGTPMSTPPFATGCVSYLTNALTLGLSFQASQQFSIAVPNDPAYIDLPLTLQGATINVLIGEVTLTNAIAARVSDC